MTKTFDTGRYDRFGWDYAKLVALTKEQVAWYKLWALRAGSVVLGLACGSGRLECRLAQAGLDVTGLDLSPTMLRLARRRKASIPAGVRRRVRFVRGNMADFEFPRRFGVIYIDDNSFRELGTRREMLRCLRCIRRHLKPHGKLLITERRPRWAKLRTGPMEFGWSRPVRHPEAKGKISRFVRIKLSKNGKTLNGIHKYKACLPDGSEKIAEFPFSAPILTVREYLNMFAQAGFSTQTFVGYKEKQDDGKGPYDLFRLYSTQNAQRVLPRRGINGFS